MNIAIIPARGGSTRIPRKNIKQFHGKPIIAYSIQTAEKSGLFDRVVVSTDDREIDDIARQYGASVLIRPQELAVNDIGTQEVARHALGALSYAMPGIEHACCIYATAPLMSVEDLRRGYELLHSNRSLYFAFSVGTSPLQDAGQFYWGWAWAFMENRPLVGPNSIMVPISDDRVCDINTEDDWLRAEQMYLNLRGTNGN